MIRILNASYKPMLVAGAVFCATLPLIHEGVAHSQSVATPSGETHQAVLELATLLEENFVFPETGVRYAALLRRNVASRVYNGLTGDDLARRVTADLQGLAPDGHLRLSAPPGSNAAAPRRRRIEQEAPIAAAGWIGEGIAYIRFNVTPNQPDVNAAIDRFMAEHATARAIIIDARSHRGGAVGPIDALLPYLYATPTRLAMLDTRTNPERNGLSPFQDGPTLRRVASEADYVRREHHVTPHQTETRLFNAQVYYLTSRRTASAAEHLAMIFKRTGRATLIGETTYGAGHFGMLPTLSGGFTAFIPIGRTYDPVTGQGWEGTGIAPDMPVPSERALERALELASTART